MQENEYQTLYQSKIGPLLLTASDKGMKKLEFGGELTGRNHINSILKQATSELDEYFSKKRSDFALPLDITATQYQMKTYARLLAIPWGTTISYAQLAMDVAGSSNHCRAVANANNKNPLPIIIPCHRVIGSNGSLTGYRGGIEVKKRLLNLEKL